MDEMYSVHDVYHFCNRSFRKPFCAYFYARSKDRKDYGPKLLIKYVLITILRFIVGNNCHVSYCGCMPVSTDYRLYQIYR